MSPALVLLSLLVLMAVSHGQFGRFTIPLPLDSHYTGYKRSQRMDEIKLNKRDKHRHDPHPPGSIPDPWPPELYAMDETKIDKRDEPQAPGHGSLPYPDMVPFPHPSGSNGIHDDIIYPGEYPMPRLPEPPGVKPDYPLPPQPPGTIPGPFPPGGYPEDHPYSDPTGPPRFKHE